jgi:hypothetical protein
VEGSKTDLKTPGFVLELFSAFEARMDHDLVSFWPQCFGCCQLSDRSAGLRSSQMQKEIVAAAGFSRRLSFLSIGSDKIVIVGPDHR